MDIQEDIDFVCPYCGSLNNIVVDLTAGAQQEWVDDCHVCCRPITISLKLQGTEIIDFRAQREDE